MSRDINIVGANLNRQIHDKTRLKFQSQFHLTDSLIKRLGLIHNFEGHTGCVNCLEWHESGEILASGSDDCNIILWNAYTKKLLKTIPSGHHGNIFSVKYIKTTSGNSIASGAADFKIRVHDVDVSECIFDCNCHTNRVKRLATPPSEPYVFMSAAEDGFILQFDLRQKHICSQTCNNVLINLTSHIGPTTEAKCISINPLQPELIAVGANDPYVRLYDRRMISLTQARPTTSPFNLIVSNLGGTFQSQENDESSCASSSASNIPLNSVQYFIAGHLKTKRKPQPVACTYLSFNSKGSELLANLGSEQIYLFDIKKLTPLHSFHLPITIPTPSPRIISTSTTTSTPESSRNGTCKVTTDGDKNNPHPVKNGFSSLSKSKYYLKVYGVKQLLPPKVQALKEQANEYFDKSDYINAVSLYNKAIVSCPNSAVLYGNRAIALMKRSWDGDVYAALRDCYIALGLDKDYFRAHFRMARCLYELKRYKEALDCFEKFKLTFPEQAKDQSCIELERKILDNLETQREREEASTQAQRDDCLCASGYDDAVNPAIGSSSSSSSAPRSLYSRKPTFSEHELAWRAKACDFKQRFCGHCNTTTDIKEANFFGKDDQFIIAGSDDGNMFIWDRTTSNIVRVLKGDDSIVNCLQPHPYDCLLASSGIDPLVRLWAPKPEDGPDSKEASEVEDINEVAIANQKLMYENPVQLALLNMGYRLGADPDSSEHPEDLVQCRAS